MAESNNKAHFPLVQQVCHISSSQEELLRRKRYVGKPESEDNNESLSGEEDGDDIPVESTGIVMISPPESPDDENQDDGTIPLRDNDVFHTPPEESTMANSQEVRHHHPVDNQEDQTVGEAPNDDLRATNLGRDTDSVLSMEEELTETIGVDDDSGIISDHSDVTKVNKDKNRGAGTPQAAGVKSLERIVKSLEKLKSPYRGEGLVKSVEKLLQNQGIEEVNEDSSVKRKLKYGGHGVENEGGIEGQSEDIEYSRSKRCLGMSSAGKRKEREMENIDDIHKYRYVGPTTRNSLEKKKDVRTKRALPRSIRTIHDGYSEPERVSDSVEKVPFSLLGVLKSLSKGYTDEPDLEKLTVLEVLKMRGMTFP